MVFRKNKGESVSTGKEMLERCKNRNAFSKDELIPEDGGKLENLNKSHKL